jgi:hypothetical protein
MTVPDFPTGRHGFSPCHDYLMRNNAGYFCHLIAFDAASINMAGYSGMYPDVREPYSLTDMEIDMYYADWSCV